MWKFHYFFESKLYTVIRNKLFQETSLITLLNEHKIIHGSKEITKDQNIILSANSFRLYKLTVFLKK